MQEIAAFPLGDMLVSGDVRSPDTIIVDENSSTPGTMAGEDREESPYIPQGMDIPEAYRGFQQQVASSLGRSWCPFHSSFECREISSTALSSSTPFQYSSLPSSTAYIRLLYFREACRKEDGLDFELFEVPLTSLPRFAALSYVWGEPKAHEQVLCNGRYLSVGYNLRNALLRFRRCNSLDGLLPLWVDAICINQDDHAERRDQILLMHTIYSQAQTVYIDLGNVGPQWYTGLVLLQRLHHVWEEICETNTYDDPISTTELLTKYDLPPFEYEAWSAYYQLFSSPWFVRTWVIQEVALARRGVAMFGSFIFKWQCLASSLEFCSRYQLTNRRADVSWQSLYGMKCATYMLRIRSGCQMPRQMEFAHYIIQKANSSMPVGKIMSVQFCRPSNSPSFLIRLLTRFRPSQQIENIMKLPEDKDALVQEFEEDNVAKYERSNIERYGMENEPLGIMEMARKFQVTNPKDKLFGILGLLHGLGSNFEPNYTMSTAEAYRYFAAYYIQTHLGVSQYPAIRMLAFAGLQRRAQVCAIPSWVPDWTASDICPREFCSLRGRSFSAVTSVESCVTLKGETTNALEINVKGMIIDEIIAITPEFPTDDEQRSGLQGAIIFSLWHKAADTIYQSACAGGTLVYEDPLKAYCLTLIADPHIEHSAADPSETPLEDVKVSHDSAWAFLESEGFAPHRARSLGATGTHFIKITAVATSRCFAITRGGRMALVPWCATLGDGIFVLCGAETPCVLRRSEERGGYMLVGDAYIHGIMYGEALSFGESVPEDLILV